MLKGNQKKIDVAKPFGKINEKDHLLWVVVLLMQAVEKL